MLLTKVPRSISVCRRRARAPPPPTPEQLAGKKEVRMWGKGAIAADLGDRRGEGLRMLREGLLWQLECGWSDGPRR